MGPRFWRTHVAPLRVDIGRQHYNTAAQVRALEALLRKLPDADAPVMRPERRAVAGRSKVIDPECMRDLVRGYTDGATISELARLFDLDRRTVRKVLKDQGIEQRHRGLLAGQVEEATELYTAGWSLACIGERMGVDGTTVLKRLRERGVQTRHPGRPKVR